MSRIDVKRFSENISIDKYINSDNKRLFLYMNLVKNSNAIENIFLDNTFITRGSIEDYLLTDHVKAYEYMMQNYDKKLSIDEIKNIHSKIMENIARLNNEKSGVYRTDKVYVSRLVPSENKEFRFKDTYEKCGKIYYTQINDNMIELENKIHLIYSKSNPGKSDLWNIHYDFEIIHPFYDGNGRTGRLLLNWLSLKHFGEFINILPERKRTYYKAISEREIEFREKNPQVKFYKNKTVQMINPIFKKIESLAKEISELKNLKKIN